MFKKTLKWAVVGSVGLIALFLIIGIFAPRNSGDDGSSPAATELTNTPALTNTPMSPLPDTPTAAPAPTVTPEPATTTPTPTGTTELTNTPALTNTPMSPLPDTPTAAPAPTMTPEPATITPTPTGTSVPAAQILIATPPTTPDCAEPETLEITALLKELQSCKPDLSSLTKDVIRLYFELLEFKDDPEFHKVGFGVCCRFNVWRQEVDALGHVPSSGVRVRHRVDVV